MDLSESLEQAVCDKHGEYTRKYIVLDGKRFLGSKCPVCDEEYFTARKQEEAEKAAKEAEARTIRALDRAGIPPRFRGKSFDNFECTSKQMEQARDVTQEYALKFAENREQGRCMIFTGKTGCGKTHLANAIANHILKDGYRVYFGSVREVVGLIKATWNKRSEKSESEVLHTLSSLDLLIMDEIGVQFDSDTEKLILFDIINARYENILPTIVLSNYPIDAESGQSIRSVLGDRVLDRMRENGGRVVQFGWQSHRTKTK